MKLDQEIYVAVNPRTGNIYGSIDDHEGLFMCHDKTELMGLLNEYWREANERGCGEANPFEIKKVKIVEIEVT